VKLENRISQYLVALMMKLQNVNHFYMQEKVGKQRRIRILVLYLIIMLVWFVHQKLS